MRTRLIFFIVAVISLTISPISLTSNAAPNPIEIISISEVSSTSVEILFDSSISKKSLSYYVINTVVTSSVGMPKNIKKVIKTKSNGLITTVIKDLNPKASYKFSVSVKTNKGKMINSEAVEYSSLSNLMDAISNLPADWGNPKPIQLPTPAPTTAPVVLPAFTLTASSETRTVNTAATGFTINSTGSTIVSFAINATPPNMSFNTTTGALTGTPNTVAAATNYTITATNASGSATQTFRLTVTAVVYTIGQTGPGGGKVFYVATTAFSCGPTLAATCTYLEAAPSGWNTGADPSLSWATNVNNQTTIVPAPGAIQTTIGTGYQNSDAIVAQTGNVAASSAAVAARAYRGNGLTDWYLPSSDELIELRANKTTVGGTANVSYWSSSELSATQAWRTHFFLTQFGVGNKNTITFSVRPIRAF